MKIKLSIVLRLNVNTGSTLYGNIIVVQRIFKRIGEKALTPFVFYFEIKYVA